MGVLVIVALIFGAIGLLLSSQATIGIAIVGLGCLSAVLARIAQAAYYRTDRR